MEPKQNRSLFSLYLAYFVDYFSWGAAVALIAIYLAEDKTPFVSFLWNQRISLAIAFAAFPMGEVIGSPILGDLSDWIGRKKVLIGGLWGSFFSFALCALALLWGHFLLFLIGQLLAGFFAGKQAMAQAAIVEIDPSSKGQKLAFLSVLGGVAWILGPFLGDLLLQGPLENVGGLIWPSLMGCVAFALAIICTHFFFVDTYRPVNRPISTLRLLKSVGNLYLLTWKEKLFFLFFLNLFGWYLLAMSLSDFLIVRFQLTESQIGFFNSYLRLCFTAGGVIGTVWVLYRWKARNILFWALAFGTLGLLLLSSAQKIAELWTYLAIPALTEAWIYPAYQIVLSDHTSETNQGKLFGLIGAANGICQFLAPWILGGLSSHISILVAALFFLASASFFPLALRKKRHARAALSVVSG